MSDLPISVSLSLSINIITGTLPTLYFPAIIELESASISLNSIINKSSFALTYLVIFTDLTTTFLIGLSFKPVFTATILSTTFCEYESSTSPNIVCF